MDFKDYYATLGVDKQAAEADIKKAYRKLARQYHPDVNPGDKAAEAKFKEINEANEVLGDPDKRKKYDELGANWRSYEGGGNGRPSSSGGGWQPFAGAGPAPGGGSYRQVTPEDMREMFGDDEGPFSDFFQTFFGGGSFGGGTDAHTRGTRGRSTRGHDVEHPLDLTLEEAFHGAVRTLSFNTRGQARSLDVRIPAGVKDGARVRVAGEGAPGSRGGPAGDLYLLVHLLPHARFERRGQDLYGPLPIPVTTAVLGGEVTVATLSGSTVRLKVPELTSSGRVFRLRGHGMPTVGKGDDRGDLYATAEIQIPARLSDEERRLYETLRDLSAAEPEQS